MKSLTQFIKESKNSAKHIKIKLKKFFEFCQAVDSEDGKRNHSLKPSDIWNANSKSMKEHFQNEEALDNFIWDHIDDEITLFGEIEHNQKYDYDKVLFWFELDGITFKFKPLNQLDMIEIDLPIKF